MNAIIIGAGIGGLTAAIALRQRGIDVTVYEAASEIKAVGAGIIMATNAMQVFQRLGVADKVKENGYKLIGGEIADQTWRSIQKIDGEYAIEKYGIGSFAIHRAALQQVLINELPEGIIRINHKVESVSQTNTNASVKFENGTT